MRADAERVRARLDQEEMPRTAMALYGILKNLFVKDAFVPALDALST